MKPKENRVADSWYRAENNPWWPRTDIRMRSSSILD